MRNTKSKIIAIALLSVAATLSAPAVSVAGSGFKIIVNSSNAATSLGKNDLSRMFMKKTAAWSDGRPILPVDLGGSDPVRKGFSKAIHGRSASAVKNNWQRMVFTGRGTPPPELQSESDVLNYVRFNPGAIGYVSATADTSSVRVIDVKP